MSKTATPVVIPHDILAEVAKMTKMTAGQLAALRAWLIELLKANAYAKLGQAGHTETGVALRQVFVDLPVTADAAGFEDVNADTSPFLQTFLAAPGLVLADIEGEDLNPRQNPKGSKPVIKRMHSRVIPGVSASASLLIGGPGQGKSTLGQYACQLHRVALLSPCLQKLQSAEQELLQSFLPNGAKKKRAPHSLSPPEKPFFPLQINLPDFCTWLTHRPVPTEQSNSEFPLMLQFLADQPSAKVAKLRLETLLQTCTNMPCLLVLDGFDEVGAKSDREHIVHSTRAMLGFLRAAKQAIKLLATTRPQGYAGEWGELGLPMAEQRLVLLEQEQALAYASVLIDAKIPGQDDRKKAMYKLTEAAQESATARLMATPLQVTILAALVQQLGRVPRARWNLFQRYFDYTYDREVERSTYASRLLAEQKLYIVQIHAQVALLLQVEAERGGGAAARMSKPQLQALVSSILRESGVAEEDCQELVHEIIRAAEERLVFLVAPEPNSFGFEIRSLQEFLAAWALTNGGDNEKIKRRLQEIAKAPMFRNVLLFAASRLYSEVSDLRAAFADEICDSVEQDEVMARLTCAGALLALEILEEGTVSNQPHFARALMKRALPLLTQPPSWYESRLARVSNKDTELVLQEALATILAKPEKIFDNMVIMHCLEVARNEGREWARTLIAKYPELEKKHRAFPDWMTQNNPYIGIALRPLKFVLEILEASDWSEAEIRRQADSRKQWRHISESEVAHFDARINTLRRERTYSAASLLDLAIFQMRLGTLKDNPETVVQNTVEIASALPKVWDDVMGSVCGGKMEEKWIVAFICKAMENHVMPHRAMIQAKLSMRVLLQNRQSNLAHPGTWAKLGLPEPGPQQATYPENEGEIPPHPVQLVNLELQNIRGLQQIKLSPSPAQEGKGQWVVILGENGVGKTTLLRSVALALRNAQDMTIWPSGAFVNTWLRIARMEEAALTQGQIAISMCDAAGQPGITHETHIQQNGSPPIQQYPAHKQPRLLPVFAYGCRRGSALGGAARKVDVEENGGPEIATLFNEGADVIHAETWLTKLDSAASKDAASAKILEAVLAALRQFLAIRDIQITADGIFVTEHNGQRLPFSMLSDGYLTSAGWLLDLLARWITLMQKHKMPLAADFMQQMRGLVLIDEIDLHLHPRWQIDIISRTRELLPQMSFFVTTHNPLTLVGARAEEIWILERSLNQDEGLEQISLKTGRDTPMFLTSSQIYRRYFGIEDIYPNQLGRKLQRYGFLTGFTQRSDAEQEEMLALQALLRENGIEPDWEILPQDKPAAVGKKSRTRKAREVE